MQQLSELVIIQPSNALPKELDGRRRFDRVVAVGRFDPFVDVNLSGTSEQLVEREPTVRQVREDGGGTVDIFETTADERNLLSNVRHQQLLRQIEQQHFQLMLQ